MRVFWAVSIIALIILMNLPSGWAACGGGCAPSADETHAKIAGLLDAAFLTPHEIVAVDKREGREIETQGRKKYEMRFSVVLSYAGAKLQCRIKLCPELHNYLLEVDEPAKKATISGWLFFEQAGGGWR